MPTSASSRPQDESDHDRFLAFLRAHADLFQRDQPVHIARAPGRLDLMGGIADYSGSLVLQWPLPVACFAAAQRADEPLCTVETTHDAPGFASHVSLSLNDLIGTGMPDYAATHAVLTASPERRWAAYVLGALVVLMREHGPLSHHGARVLVHSDIPIGAGLASSAALEVASMRALAAAYGIEVEGRELALLCQRVENLIVGAPCGVMDQMTAALGEPGRLLCLLCQPAEVCSSVPLPVDLEVWGINSGIQHDVAGADYGSVRAGAFMGYRILAEERELPVTEAEAGKVVIDDRMWGGYLANVPVSTWEARFRDRVPETLSGNEFLNRYGGLTDAVTRVEPETVYAVRHPTAHPIYEHHRVRLFRALLERDQVDEEIASLLGELMYASHASYGACGLGSHGTDQLVKPVQDAGPSSGLLGAKITGAGSGGTVAVLTRRGSGSHVQRIAQRYARETAFSPTIFGGSSPGAMLYGVSLASV
jgi:L-arabinokinase